MRGGPHIRIALVALLVLVPSALLAPAFAAVSPLDDCTTREAPLPPCNVWASRPPTGPANELHIAIDPTDAQHILAVAKDYSLGSNSDCRPGGAYHVGSASYVTFDGGLTWDVARVPAPYPNGGAEPSPLAYKCGSDPVAMFGPDGTAYYLVLNFQYAGGRQASIAVARSADGGLSWPASEIRILHVSGGDDKEWGAVGKDGAVHVVWVDVNNGAIYYARSNPATWTFTAPIVLATAGGGNPAVTVDTGPNNEVYAVWRSSGSILFRKSLDGGATWQTTRTAFTTSAYDFGGPPRLPFMPQIAVDDSPTSPYSGSLYVTWPRATGAEADVYLAYSRDGGATWSAQIKVSDDASGRRQAMPTVGVAPNGRVDVAWLDQRLTPSADLWTAFIAHSTNGGATWSANRQAQELPLDQAWSFHQDGSIFIGDYIGIASSDAYAYPIFPGNGLDRLDGLTPAQLRRADAYVGVVPTDGLAVDAFAPIVEETYPSTAYEHETPRGLVPE